MWSPLLGAKRLVSPALSNRTTRPLAAGTDSPYWWCRIVSVALARTTHDILVLDARRGTMPRGIWLSAFEPGLPWPLPRPFLAANRSAGIRLIPAPGAVDRRRLTGGGLLQALVNNPG